MNRVDLDNVKEVMESVERIYTIVLENMDNEPYFKVRDLTYDIRSRLATISGRIREQIDQIELDL